MDSNLHTSIDHIVIVSPSLDAGIKYVYETLGVMPQIGGTHIKMGTHNALLKLGSSTYLEVIAINPSMKKPDRARWFELDNLSANSKPKLLTWIASTDDIYTAVNISSLSFGNIETMSRAELNWLITVPADGSLLCDGVAPSLIQWLNKLHLASRLSDVGCSLIRIESFHPNAKTINNTLKSIGFSGSFSVKQITQLEKPFITAYIQTPNGIRNLTSDKSFRISMDD